MSSIASPGLIRHTIYLFAGRLGEGSFAFFQGIVVARSLGGSAYGILGIIFSYQSLIKSIIGFRTDEPLTRYLIDYRLSGDTKKLRLLFGSAVLADLTTNFITMVVLFSIAPWAVSAIAENPANITTSNIYAVTVLLTSFDALWFCTARDSRNFFLISTLPAAFSALSLVIVLILWRLNLLTLINFAYVSLFIASIRQIYIVGFLKKILPEKYKLSLYDVFQLHHAFRQRKSLSEFWTFMWTTYYSSIVSTSLKNCPLLVLGHFRPTSDVGVVRLAQNIGSLIQSFGGILSNIIYQDFSELMVAKKLQETNSKILRILKIWTPLCIMGTAIAIVAARPFIIFHYGEQFSGAVIPFQIIMLGIGTVTCLFWVRPLGLAADCVKQLFYLNTALNFAIMGALILLTRKYGTIGTAISISMMWALTSIGALVIIYKKMKFLNRVR